VKKNVDVSVKKNKNKIRSHVLTQEYFSTYMW